MVRRTRVLVCLSRGTSFSNCLVVPFVLSTIAVFPENNFMTSGNSGLRVGSPPLRPTESGWRLMICSAVARMSLVFLVWMTSSAKQ